MSTEIRELARGGLRAAARVGTLELSGELGFAILHRCGESFYFLLVSTWRNENELWETVWAKDGDDEAAFAPWQVDGRTGRPSACGSSARSATSGSPGAATCARGAGAVEREAYVHDTFAGGV